MAASKMQIKDAYEDGSPPPVEIIDARESEDFRESEGGRWVTFCQTHGEFLQHRYKSEAESVFGRMSVNWCEACARQATEEALADGLEAYEADLGEGVE